MLETLLRILLVIKQSLTVLNFLHPSRHLVSGNPRLENSIQRLQVSTILSIQGMIVVIITCAGNEFLESIGTFIGEAEFLDVLNVASKNAISENSKPKKKIVFIHDD